MYSRLVNETGSPSTKTQGISNHQVPTGAVRRLVIEAWSFPGVWGLGFGASAGLNLSFVEVGKAITRTVYSAKSILVELGLDQLFELLESLVRIGSFAPETEL